MILISCGDDEPTVTIPEVESRLVSSDKRLTRLKGDLIGIFDNSGLDLPFDQIKYDVQIWEVEYETYYGDQVVTASSMVFLPESDEPVPFLSYQHGTIANNSAAPTQVPASDTQNLLLTGLAGIGFVVVAPDYIGFGSSVDIVHPYYVEQATRDAVLDGLRSAVELAIENEIQFGPELYLMGYSQGGYATMAAHKGIEEMGIEYFDLQASYPSSGGYDVIGVRDYFFSLETYHQPFFLAYVAESYRTYYGWPNENLSKVFQEPFATNIPQYFDGSLSGGEINLLLNDTISILTNEAYYTNPNDPEFDFVTSRFEENSIDNWVPTIPVHMFHGDADITVPYQNSIDVYDGFIAAGADPNVVTFTPIPGGTHGGGAFPWILETVDRLLLAEGISN